jgi:Predicted integral membrane protein (DUF2269)
MNVLLLKLSFAISSYRERLSALLGIRWFDEVALRAGELRKIDMLDSPAKAVIAGLVLAALALAVWLLTGPVDPRGLISVLLRFVHVLSAMVWVGLIFFVNFIQLRALQEADVSARSAIAKWIVPHVATMFRHASHLTVLSGALLLVATGYLLRNWVFASAVFMPVVRAKHSPHAKLSRSPSL